MKTGAGGTSARCSRSLLFGQRSSEARSRNKDMRLNGKCAATRQHIKRARCRYVSNGVLRRLHVRYYVYGLLARTQRVRQC
jgi:hypothetical protein